METGCKTACPPFMKVPSSPTCLYTVLETSKPPRAPGFSTKGFDINILPHLFIGRPVNCIHSDLKMRHET